MLRQMLQIQLKNSTRRCKGFSLGRRDFCFSFEENRYIMLVPMVQISKRVYLDLGVRITLLGLVSKTPEQNYVLIYFILVVIW